MTSKDWLAYCLAKPGAWRDEPWEGDVVAKVGSKIFAFVGGVDPQTSIGLKCGDREQADLLARPLSGQGQQDGLHRSARLEHFTLDGSIPDDEVAELVDTSYQLIVAKLPKKDRPTG